MLRNDKVNLVIALLIAIGLWVYVLGEVNPTKETTLRNIPITYLNQDSLTEEELILLSASDTTVNVTISGKRSDTGKVKESDVRAYADLEGCTKGEHTIRLRIVVPDTVELENVSTENISVVIDELVTEDKPVSASLTGEVNDDTEPYIVQVSQEEVAVTGAKTLVDSIVKLNAPLDTSRVSSEMKSFNVSLIPVDKDGNTVENVSMDRESVSITAVLLNKKTVNLEVPVVGETAGDIDRTVSVPKTITIKGTEADLSNISLITAEVINVSNIYEDTTVPIVPVLPDRIELAASSQSLTAKVTVKGMENITFEYKADAVELEGVPDDMLVTIGDVTIKLVVTGRESVISQLTREDFHFSADITELGAGTHKVQLECRYDADISEIDLTPQEIEITIEEG